MTCAFCEIISKTRQADIVYEDEEYVAFKDLVPDAEYHIQLIPKNHIKNVGECTKADIPMLRSMQQLGNTILRDQLSSDNNEHLLGTFRFGFHAPGNTSVDHLHCHCMAGKKKFSTFFTHNSLFPWFVAVDTVINRLSRFPENRKFLSKE